MGHTLSMLMWKKVHKHQHTLTVLEFSNFTKLHQKICFNFFFKRTQTKKAPAGLELIIYRLVAHALTFCATRLGTKFGKEKI